MKMSRTPFLIAAAAVALTASGVVSASSYYHPDGTERGVTVYPDHISSTKTRADVYRELEEAKKKGLFGVQYNSWTIFQLGNEGPGKTRAQVQEELRNVTPEQKQQWNELYGKN